MQIKISRENTAYWQKKGALGVRFEAKGNDGMITEQAGKSTLTLAIGEPEEMTRRKLVLLARRIVREALRKKFRSIALDFGRFRFPKIGIADSELAELLTVNFRMANFAFRDFLSVPDEGWPEIKTIALMNAPGGEIRAGIERGMIIGEEVNRSRHIADMPGGEMTPEILAAHARQSVKGLPVKTSVLMRRR
jgi:leucyl aminopeptidase